LQRIQKRKQEAIWQATFSFPRPYSTASSHSIPSLGQALVHHDPRNLQSEPFRQPFDADSELVELKTPDFND
jgi:hypothetical protein